MRREYDNFLHAKGYQSSGGNIRLPGNAGRFLFPFQRDLVSWSLDRGRSAIFADCGLGKTPMQLVWANGVAENDGKPVLILTPLAVSPQTIREGRKFGISVERSRDGSPCYPITVTNYERLERFSPADFSGLVCDESSILKSFDGVRRKEITEFARKVPYRLLCTATAAPNDYTELGTSSEALGEMGHMDMLNRFFVNKQNTSDTKEHWRGFAAPREFKGPGWRFKGHAETPFWQWVCSWARAVRRPSDLGYEDDGFILPPLNVREHTVTSRSHPPGMLFSVRAVNLREQREERRRTIQERCEKVTELVENTGRPALVWCHLNAEGDRLSEMISDAEQVSGSDSDDDKEAKLTAFANGDLRVLVTKPKIGAWGLNLQICSHVVYFPSHSYEQYYQAVRRCWRFGQERPVTVDIVATEGDKSVMENLGRKAIAADEMFSRLVSQMNAARSLNCKMRFEEREEIPAWLQTIGQSTK